MFAGLEGGGTSWPRPRQRGLTEGPRALRSDLRTRGRWSVGMRSPASGNHAGGRAKDATRSCSPGRGCVCGQPLRCMHHRPATSGPTPIPTTPIPTAQQLVSAYASTLAHDRFQFDLKSSASEEIGTLDDAHDSLDLTTPGSAQLEVRHIGSHEWARNAVDLDPNPGSSGSPEDSPAWLITPGGRGDVMSQLPREFPLVALLTGLDRTGTSPVRLLGAADVKGAPTVGYRGARPCRQRWTARPRYRRAARSKSRSHRQPGTRRTAPRKHGSDRCLIPGFPTYWKRGVVCNRIAGRDVVDALRLR